MRSESLSDPKSGRRNPIPDVGLILLSAIFLYLHLFVPPFTPIWSDGDQFMFLEDAHRMLHGQVFYRDFLEVAFPATDAVYLALFKVFGLHMWIPNLMLLLVGIALAYVSYYISRRLDLGHAAFLPPLLFLSLIYRERLDATHHWYSVLVSMVALAILLDRRSLPRVMCAGLLCGIATGFTQTLGALVFLAFAAFLYWESRIQHTGPQAYIQNLSVFVGCFAVAIGTIVGLTIHIAGFQGFVFSTLIFAFRYYPTWPVANDWRGYMVGLSSFLQMRHLPALFGFAFVHALLPAVYVLFFWRYHRCRPRHVDERWDRLLLVSLVGTAGFLSVAPAPTWPRLYYVCLPAIVLFVWLLKSWGGASQRVSYALILLPASLVIAFPITKQLHSRAYLDLPVGRVAFLNSDAYYRYAWVASRTRPGDFFFALSPEFYFVLDLRNPASVQYVSPYEYTRPEQVQELINGLEAHNVKILLWNAELDFRTAVPGDHLDPLRAYLRRCYRVTDEFPHFEALIRKEGPL
jgi:hypothetical protein